MGDGTEDTKDQLAGCRGGVDLFLKPEQIDLALAQHLHRFEQFCQRSAETDDGECVAGAGIGQQFGQAWPIHALTRFDIGEDLDGAGMLEAHEVLEPRLRGLVARAISLLFPTPSKV